MKPGLKFILFFCFIVFFLIEESKCQTVSGIINSYFKVTNFIPAYNAVRVQNISGLTSGDRVMLIQMKGATINETNTASFGAITSIGQAGLYEFATICGFLNDTVVFQKQLLNSYDYTKSVQLVYVPTFTDVTIAGTLLAQEWNSTTGTGGVIALEATGTITMNAGIEANGAGYKGGELVAFSTCSFFTTASAYYYSPATTLGSNSNGAYKGEGINITQSGFEGGKGKQSNGGGGGNNHNTGGGGGANYGAGGIGGNYIGSGGFPCNGSHAGIGASALNSYGYSLGTNRIFAGGGGGSGHENNPEGTPGGNGGGIIFIKCDALIGNNNSITANGVQGLSTNPSNVPSNEGRGDGGGGGGAAGVILLHVNSYTTSLNIEAKGANGSTVGFQAQCPGPGGGGGGGVIWASSALPANVTSTISGGAAGIIKPTTFDPACEGSTNNATAGTAGIVLTNFQILEGSLFNCGGILPIASLKEWNGKRVSEGIELKWRLEQTDDLEEIKLEKKLARGSFTVLHSYRQPQEAVYQFLDRGIEFPATYRLMIQTKTGKKEYSTQLFFERQKVKRLNLYPNPVTNEVRLELPASSAGRTVVVVFDYTGKQVLRKEIVISNQSYTILQLTQLAAGTYTVQLYWKDELYIGKIVKQ